MDLVDFLLPGFFLGGKGDEVSGVFNFIECFEIWRLSGATQVRTRASIEFNPRL